MIFFGFSNSLVLPLIHSILSLFCFIAAFLILKNSQKSIVDTIFAIGVIIHGLVQVTNALRILYDPLIWTFLSYFLGSFTPLCLMLSISQLLYEPSKLNRLRIWIICGIYVLMGAVFAGLIVMSGLNPFYRGVALLCLIILLIPVLLMLVKIHHMVEKHKIVICMLIISLFLAILGVLWDAVQLISNHNIGWFSLGPLLETIGGILIIIIFSRKDIHLQRFRILGDLLYIRNSLLKNAFEGIPNLIEKNLRIVSKYALVDEAVSFYLLQALLNADFFDFISAETSLQYACQLANKTQNEKKLQECKEVEHQIEIQQISYELGQDVRKKGIKTFKSELQNTLRYIDQVISTTRKTL